MMIIICSVIDSHVDYCVLVEAKVAISWYAWDRTGVAE